MSEDSTHLNAGRERLAFALRDAGRAFQNMGRAAVHVAVGTESAPGLAREHVEEAIEDLRAVMGNLKSAIRYFHDESRRRAEKRPPDRPPTGGPTEIG